MTSPLLQKFGIDNFKGEFNNSLLLYMPISIFWKLAFFYFK